jgi:predicted AAA+ superfamily ATPase
MYIKRYIETSVAQDLGKKMVFIGGPRQSGKTTTAKNICFPGKNLETERYLTWDALDDRHRIMKEDFPAGKGALVLDEIHKYSRWRQTVKGLFDKRGHDLRILVTGSARLDHYRRGDDSLQGRYHFYRLLPLSLSELAQPTRSTLTDLLTYGGFPEPFLSASEKESNRWSNEYRSRVVREDLRDLELVHDINLLDRLSLRLPELVGSPLSINSLREDLEVSHKAVARWVSLLENLYAIFRIYPFGSPKIRAVKKEAKHYHMDWTLVKDPGARFENLVACHLLKWCFFLQDSEGRNPELRYFRDIDKREVDFVIVENGKPAQFIECKLAGTDVSPALRYLKERFSSVASTQVVLETDKDSITKDGIRVCPAHVFLKEFV